MVGTAMGMIVVGADGSEESRRALRWAFDIAGPRGDHLRIVHVYDYRPPLGAFATTAGMSPEQTRTWYDSLQAEAARVRADAEAVVDSMVAEAMTAEGVDDEVEFQKVLLEGRHPAEALVEQAQDADMLVVGSRGRGGLSGMVLGSVSQQCLHRATCPVVVVRAT